jgi:2-dehydropantoate 2-reductase
MEVRLKILNLSCGAVGAYFCGKLAQNGFDVAVTVRSDIDLIKRQGFKVKSINGDFVFMPSAVLARAGEYNGIPDYVIVSSKALPQADIVGSLREIITPASRIVLIQNGLDIEEEIAQAFPDNEILSAIAYIGVTRTAPGQVEHIGNGRLIIGKYKNGPSAGAQELCRAFECSGVPAQYTEDIAHFRWKKLLWNIPFNALSVLGGGLLTGEMTDSGETEWLCRKLMEEAAAVAEAEKISGTDEMIADGMQVVLTMPENVKTSMLQDVLAKRVTEVDAFAGTICQKAALHKIPVPFNQDVLDKLQ